MRKNAFVVFMIVIVLFIVPTFAELVSDEQHDMFDSYVDELRESDRIFTVPVHVGPIYSVIVRKDGVGIVFSMIKSKALSLGLEAVSFATDLAAMDVFLENGEIYTIPAIVEIQTYDVGSFITVNMRLSTVTSLVALISSDSPIVKFTFVQGNGNRTDMTVDEVNKALSDATGSTVDVVKQAGEAIRTFWNNLSGGAGHYASNAYEAISSFFSNAGDFFSNAADGAGDFFGDAKDKAGDVVNSIKDGVSNLWNGLFGH